MKLICLKLLFTHTARSSDELLGQNLKDESLCIPFLQYRLHVSLTLLMIIPDHLEAVFDADPFCTSIPRQQQ